MRLETIVREWTERADNDLASANFLMEMRPIPLEIIGFHCQQAIEKYLKAFLVKKGVEPEKTHDLGLLLERCRKFDDKLASLAETCALLTDFAVETRYPTSIALDLDKIQGSLSVTQEAIAYIVSRLEENEK